jgi:hypothetical protein
MIQITKGNPTPDEVAALVVALTLASAVTQPVPNGSKAACWRRSTPLARLEPVAPSRRDRCWRSWTAGWSRVGRAEAPTSHRVHWAGTRNVS